MPKQYIIDYLNQNKEKFSLDILKKKLITAGYPESEIDEAIRLIQQPPSATSRPEEISTSFWDFRHKKIYKSGREKFLDFLFGFLLSILCSVLTIVLRIFGFQIFGLFYLALIIYFFAIKRGYVSLGMIFSWVIIAMIIIFIIFGLSGISLSHFHF